MSSISSYSRVSSRGSSYRGFKLRYSRRFSIQAFRTRFVFLFKVVNKWKYTCYEAMKFVKRSVYGSSGDRRIGKVSEMESSRSMNVLLGSDLIMPRSHECRMRSLGRSNSFYSEAIADCLEFIKRTSVSDKEEDDKPVEKIIPTISSGTTSEVVVRFHESRGS